MYINSQNPKLDNRSNSIFIKTSILSHPKALYSVSEKIISLSKSNSYPIFNEKSVLTIHRPAYHSTCQNAID